MSCGISRIELGAQQEEFVEQHRLPHRTLFHVEIRELTVSQSSSNVNLVTLVKRLAFLSNSAT